MFLHKVQIENNHSVHTHLIISICELLFLILIQHCEKCVWQSLCHRADSDLGMVEAFLYILCYLNVFVHSWLISYTNKQFYLSHGTLLSSFVVLYE